MDYSAKEGIVEYFFEKIKYFTLPSESNNYRSRFLESKILLYCVVLLLMLKIAVVFVPINFPKNIFFADITQVALENFANQTRQSVGLQPLAESAKLDKAAQLKAQNMVANNYFAHTSPTGLTPWHWFLLVGYNYKYAGENLAIGFFDSDEVYKAWLNSPEHRAN
ncbi:MAG: CAP domain-containing protein, partial [Candidatus Staskawiczbacteria bacterium]